MTESLSNRNGPDKTNSKPKNSIWRIIFLLSFPLIGLFLYVGDSRTRQAKEKLLIESAKYMVVNNKAIMDKLAFMTFDSVYLHEVSTALKLISKEDKNFPSVSLIHFDTIGAKEVFLQFNQWFHWSEGKSKADFIYSATFEEREYLKNIFQNKSTGHRFTASDGNYELYYPVHQNNKIFILYITDRQRYGKIGS